MLDAKELARRLRQAMDSAQPRVSSAALAAASGVTPQAVNGWRKTGRIAKRHLKTVSNLTKRPLEYFLEEDPRLRAREPAATYDGGQLTAKEEIVLYLLAGLVPEQQRDYIERMKATFETNQALARQMGGKPLRFVSNAAIAASFGTVAQTHEAAKKKQPKRGRHEPGTAMDDFLEDPE